MASIGRGGHARERAVSRLPQRKRAHRPPASATSNNPIHSTEAPTVEAPVLATNATGTPDYLQTIPPFHPFLCTGPKLTPDDLESLSRILEPTSHAGAALAFLLRHVVGRDRVARVRAVLGGLQHSQDPSSEALFTSSTFQAYTTAQKDLTRTRALVAARNKELQGLIQEGDAANENLTTSQHSFAAILAREYVLRTLREKEEVRAARIKGLSDLVDKCVRAHESPDNPTFTLDTALEAIRARLLYEISGSHPGTSAIEHMSSDLIRAATSPPALRLLSERVEEARKGVLTLLNARRKRGQAAGGVGREELVDDVLCLQLVLEDPTDMYLTREQFLRARYNVLKRLERMRGAGALGPSGSTNTSDPIESATVGSEESGLTTADLGTKAKAGSRDLKTSLTALTAAIEVALGNGQGRGIPGEKRVADVETRVSEIRAKLIQAARRRVRTRIEPRVGLDNVGNDETEDDPDSNDIWARLHNAPSKADLDHLYKRMNEEKRRTTGLLGLYTVLRDVAEHNYERVRKGKDTLAEISAECVEREGQLLGYVDTRRRGVIDETSSENARGDDHKDQDIHEAVGLPHGTAPLPVLKAIVQMTHQAKEVGERVGRLGSISGGLDVEKRGEVGSVAEVIESHKTRQDALLSNTVSLLERKMHKLNLGSVVQRDIDRLLGEAGVL